MPRSEARVVARQARDGQHSSLARCPNKGIKINKNDEDFTLTPLTPALAHLLSSTFLFLLASSVLPFVSADAAFVKTGAGWPAFHLNVLP